MKGFNSYWIKLAVTLKKQCQERDLGFIKEAEKTMERERETFSTNLEKILYMILPNAACVTNVMEAE